MNQIIGELACSLVLLEVPLSQAMLANKLCVTAVLSMVNILWTKMLAGPQGEVSAVVRVVDAGWFEMGCMILIGTL